MEEKKNDSVENVDSVEIEEKNTESAEESIGDKLDRVTRKVSILTKVVFFAALMLAGMISFLIGGVANIDILLGGGILFALFGLIACLLIIEW